MKKTILNILLCALPLFASAQSSSSDNSIASFVRKYIKHFDITFTAGTQGFGFEVEAPLCKWSKMRFGGVYLPVQYYNCTLDVWKPLGMTENDALYKVIASTMSTKPSGTVDMAAERTMKNLKLLFDFYPIKKLPGFYVTAGLFFGNSNLVSGGSTAAAFSTLSFIREYNMIYDYAVTGKKIDLSSVGIGQTTVDKVINMFDDNVIDRIRQSEDMTIPVGIYSHDIYNEDGELLHSKGDYVMLRPNKNDVINIQAEINVVKPYIGVGYTQPVSRDKRSFISLDAGMLIWGGVPSVTTEVVEGNRIDVDSKGNKQLVDITTTIDLNNDVEHLPNQFGQFVRSATVFPVYPEVCVRFTRRIW